MSFAPAVSYPTGASPQATVTADFNNDGNLDLVSANAGDNTVSALLGHGDGTFQPALTSATGSPTDIWMQSLAVGDFNDDGMLDLATGNSNYYGTGTHDVTILLGNGDGTFEPAVPLIARSGYASFFVATGDLNGDAKVDLVLTFNPPEGGMGMSGVGLLLGRGDGTFTGVASPPQFTDGPEPNSAPVLADFNRDGKIDVGVPTGWGGAGVVKVYLGNGDGTLAQPRDVVTSANTFAATSATVGDFNGDSRLDLVTVDYNYSTSLLLGNGDGTFQAWQSIAAWGAAGDVNGDGALDLVAGPGAFLGYGDGSFAPWTGEGAGSSAVLADFNGDGRLDAAGPNWVDGVSVLINDGDWSFPPPAISVSDATVTEGNTGAVNATFTLTLSQASDVDVTVDYATSNITAAAGDYTAASGTVTIPAGQTSKTFSVAVIGDRLAEPSEKFAVNLSAPTNASIRDGQGIGTILDDEPRVSINNVSKSEGNGKTSFTFTVGLSAAYDQPVSVNYATANGTATAGADYQSKTGILTFAPGERTKTITIVIIGDKQKEANETFFLDLFGPSSNVLMAVARGIGSIFNDDGRV